MTWRVSTAALLVAGMLFGVPTSWGASIAFSRQAELAAAGRTSDEQFSLSDLFDEFGLYDQTIGQSLFPPSGGTTRAQAAQRSDVDAALVAGQASGSASAQVAEFDAIAASARSTFLLVFDVVDQPETIDLAGNLSSTFDSTARVLLSDQGGATLFEQSAANQQLDLDFDEQVPLPPGRYVLLAEALLSATPVPNTATFDIRFSVTNPIPLPTPIWPAGAGLIAAVVIALKRKSTGPVRVSRGEQMLDYFNDMQLVPEEYSYIPYTEPFPRLPFKSVSS